MRRTDSDDTLSTVVGSGSVNSWRNDDGQNEHNEHNENNENNENNEHNEHSEHNRQYRETRRVRQEGSASMDADVSESGNVLADSRSESDRYESSDGESLWTSRSEETLINNTMLFGVNAASYQVVREMPVVSSFLQSGVQLFASQQSLETYMNRGRIVEDELKGISKEGLGTPLLQTNTSVLSIFKKNAPFMVINRLVGHDRKEEFCRVNFKILATNLTCWVLTFNLSSSCERVVLINNGIRPSVDFHWRDTKCRVTGVSGTTSTFGNGLFKSYIMSDSAVLSCDNLHLKETGKSAKVAIDDSNPLCKCIIRHDRTAVNKIMSEGSPLFNFPVCTYIDNGNAKLQGKLMKNGTIRLFDQTLSEITDRTLVLASVLLVLREQEYRKNRGNSKPC